MSNEFRFWKDYILEIYRKLWLMTMVYIALLDFQNIFLIFKSLVKNSGDIFVSTDTVKNIKIFQNNDFQI